MIINIHRMSIVFLILIMFSSCTKFEKNLVNAQKITEIIENVANDTQKNEYINENYFTIVEIREFIFNDLNLNYYGVFNNVEEILSKINLPDNYNTKEYSSEPGWFPDLILSHYIIEWEDFHLSFVTSNEINYYYYSYIEIIINENNYLNIFPYNKMEKYISDTKFGIVNDIRKYKSITYEVKDDEESEYPIGLIYLEFKQDLLYSIGFRPYIM